MADASFGHNLGPLRCKVCGEGRPRWPQGLCFDCYRKASGYTPPVPKKRKPHAR